MQTWRIERGTLWGLETSQPLPAPCTAKIETQFQLAQPSDLSDLAEAMNLPNVEPLHKRLQTAQRRCFILRSHGRLVTYGWVSKGAEHVGELERYFNFANEDAYIWDCGTVPDWRGQHCYSTLLSQLIYHLQGEGVPRIWIGASRQNQPSVKGFVNAGFNWVLDLTYRRYRRLSVLWFEPSGTASPVLISTAYEALVNDHEQRIGRLAVGYKRR